MGFSRQKSHVRGLHISILKRDFTSFVLERNIHLGVETDLIAVSLHQCSATRFLRKADRINEKK